MKNARLTLMFLACTAAIPAFAQNTTDSRCGTTNYDSSRNIFTIMNATPATPNQQCFITVVSKDSWTGGAPNLSTSQMIEGNYEISLSGGGGGGGGGTDRVGGGGGGVGAVPLVTTQYLSPGIYRLTVGAGGRSGAANGGKGGDGAPTSLSNATTGQLIAGYPGAESWNGTYQSSNLAQADSSGGQAIGGQSAGGRGGRIGGDYKGQDGGKLAAIGYAGEPGKGGTDLAGNRMRHEVAGGGGGGAGFGNGGNGDSSAEDGKGKTGAGSGNMGAGGGGGAGGEHVADNGSYGGNGFIKLALKDPVVSAQPAPMQAAAATASTQNYTAPAPAATRPVRKDRN